MSHKIFDTDITLSTKGTEWHQKAKTTERIDDLTIQPLLFPIVNLNLSGEFEGEVANMSDYQAIAADLRDRGLGVVPLGVHSKRYHVIENKKIWECLQKALKGLGGYQVTNAGTLGNCKRFFISVQLDEAPGFKVGDEVFKGYLNFVTGHGGDLAPTFYDSSVRIVCQNTLNWSMNRKGDHWFKAKHTASAELELDAIAKHFNNMLESRESLAKRLERAANEPVTMEEARHVVSGWQYDRLQEKPEAHFSVQSVNIINGVLNLFEEGQGNKGESRYDLINGMTEFYTSGAGAGSARVSDTQRGANARFGGPAKLKTDFVQRVTEPAEYERLRLTGKSKAVALMN